MATLEGADAKLATRAGGLPSSAAAPHPRELGLSEVYLQPGALFAASEPTLVRTILGSCVAVCLFDPSRRVGGLNHYLLPHWVAESEASPRYGVVAIQSLIERIVALGSRRHSLRAKVFGGLRVLAGSGPSAFELGRKNAALAFELLAEAGVPVLAQDVGGSRSRKLVFRTDDGMAWVRRL